MALTGHWEVAGFTLTEQRAPGDAAGVPSVDLQGDLTVSPDESVSSHGQNLWLTEPVAPGRFAANPDYTGSTISLGTEESPAPADAPYFFIGQYRETSFGSTGWLLWQTWTRIPGSTEAPSFPVFIEDDIPVGTEAVFSRVQVSSIGPAKIKYVTIK